jgi:hypothetical protein
MKEAAMHMMEHAGDGLYGRWQDVIRGPDGTVIHHGEVRPNAIVRDCRRILAALLGGSPALGIQGMLFGAGDSAWDGSSPPPATAAQTALVEPNPFLVPAADLQMDFVDDLGVVSATPTNRLQIVASLGAGLPPWPDGNHVAGSLREFGLVGVAETTPRSSTKSI